MSERQLLLSKAMLMRGESVLQSSGIFDASISLLLLQDSVEMALHAVATKIGAKPPRKAAFEDYWGLIDSAGSQFGQLPMKIEMGRMNSARVDLKHHGNRPDRDGVEEHFRNGRAFLGKLTAQYFSPLDFERLSIVSLVTDEEIRAQLERQPGRTPKDPPKAQAAQIAQKDTEIANLRALMKAGNLSAAAAQAAITTLEREREELSRPAPDDREKQTARILRMLPRSADQLRERVTAGNLGLRDPNSILQARNALFDMFGGRVALRRAEPESGENPFLIARVGINRGVLLAAAGSISGCVISGSGGRI